MAELSWPFENQDTTETEYSELFKRLQNDGVAGDPTTNLLRVTGDSSGMNVKLAAGFAIVRGHIYHNTAELTLTISPAAAQPRIDLVVLELDPTGNAITAKVIDGTASATPTPPTLTQTNDAIYQLAIASVAVGANVTTISAGNVTDTRPFTGAQWGVWTTSTRPTSPRVGLAGYNTTTAQPEFWNGTAWTVFTPAEISAAIITSGTLSMDRIGTEAITAGKLATNSVTEVKINNSAVTTDKVANSAITTAKLASTASVDFVTAKRVFIQTATPSSSGRVTGDVWISW
jgi:hypothetical protein